MSKFTCTLKGFAPPEWLLDADVVGRWLNLLEGYFSVHEFSDWEKIIFHSSKLPPMSRTGGKPTVIKRMRRKPTYSQMYQIRIICKMQSRNNNIPWGVMRTSTYNVPCCDNKGIKMCMS